MQLAAAELADRDADVIVLADGHGLADPDMLEEAVRPRRAAALVRSPRPVRASADSAGG